MACCAIAAYVIFRLVTIHEQISGTLKFRLPPALAPASGPAPSPGPAPLARSAPANAASCILSLDGLVCATCVRAVQAAFKDCRGVSRAVTSLALLRAHVMYDRSLVSPADLVRAVEAAGYGAVVATATTTSTTTATSADTALGSSDQRETWEDLRSAFETSGAARARDVAEWQRAFAVSSVAASVAVGVSYARLWVAVARGGGGALAILGVQLVAAVVCVLASRRIHAESARSLWRGKRRRNMSTLTSLGICMALAQSLLLLLAPRATPRAHVYSIVNRLGALAADASLDGICVLTTVVLGGRLLKAVASQHSLGFGAGLAALIPRSALVVTADRHGAPVQKPIHLPSDLVAPGDRIVVGEGERIPADGAVSANTALISETWMTGSASPRAVKPGDPVHAGSTVDHGELVVTAQACGGETRLGKMLLPIATAEMEEPSQGVTDKIADIFIDVIMLLVAAALVVHRFFLDATWADSLTRATSMLLCACPCAFSLSVPTCLLAATAVACKADIQLATSIQRVENAAGTRTVLFDKTGTLTEARLRASCVIVAPGWNDTAAPRRLLAWWAVVGALERHVRHPVAVAIVDESDRQLSAIRARLDDDDVNVNVKSPELTPRVSDVDYVPGRGLQGWVSVSGSAEPMHVAIGSRKFMSRLGVAVDYSAVPESARSAIASTVAVAIDHAHAGIIVCEDVIRPTSRAAVEGLTRRGIDVGLLTGDSAASAALVARAVGIPAGNVFADRLPMEKAEVVADMQRRGPVTFVGDNLNDVPAFASSSFSVCVVSDGSAQSSPSPASADAFLFPLGSRLAAGDAELDKAATPGLGTAPDTVDLTRLSYLISLSAATVRRVKQNFLWTAVYNIVSLLLGSGVLQTLHPRLTLSP